MVRNIIVVLALSMLSITAVSAITVDEVIKNHLQARGGESAFKKLKSLKIEGTMMTMGGEASLTQYFKGGNMIRVDLSLQGMAMTQAFDGKTAWAINPMSGGKAQKSSDDQASTMSKLANFAGELVHHKEMGYELVMAGSEDIDGMTAYKIKVTDLGGDSWTTYIDAVTWLTVRTDRTTEMGGQSFDVQVYFSNYKDVAGVQLPTQIDTKAQGQDFMSMTWDKIEPNVTIPDSQFAYPGE